MGEHEAAAAADFRIGDRVALVEAVPSSEGLAGPKVGAAGSVVDDLVGLDGSHRLKVRFDGDFAGGHGPNGRDWWCPAAKLRLIRSAEACAAAAASCAKPADPKLAAGLEGRTLEPLFPVGARVRVVKHWSFRDPPEGAAGIVDRVDGHLRLVVLDVAYSCQTGSPAPDVERRSAWLMVSQLAADPSPTTSALPPSHRGAAGSVRRQMEAETVQILGCASAEEAAALATRRTAQTYFVETGQHLDAIDLAGKTLRVRCDPCASALVREDGSRIEVTCQSADPAAPTGWADEAGALDAIRDAVRDARKSLAADNLDAVRIAETALDRIFDLTLPERYRARPAAERAA